MKQINLINKSMSEVNYELTTFPDGEPHINIVDDIDRKDTYSIICRVTNPSDLFILMQVGNILNLNYVQFDITITYLMSMRMDRVITFNEAFTLKIVGDIINMLKANHVYIFECHSDRAFSIINNSSKIDLLKNNKTYIDDFVINYRIPSIDSAVCFPDKGAHDRYKNEYMGVNVIQMKKVRDLENKGIIKQMEIQEQSEYMGNIKSITIVDDLCDGGGTFCWAADILKKTFGDNVEINLFVKHMVNEAGLNKVAKIFSNVYITDSYKDWITFIKDKDEYKNVHVFKLF